VKGLLLKDWYMMQKYCRSYLLVAAAFIAVSLFGNGNMFFVFYPCLLCGLIPVNLLNYDEQSRWMQYSAALPCTKTQIVSTKYLIGLLAQVTMLIIIGAAQGIKMTAAGHFVFGEYAVLLLLVLIVATFTSSISLPFIFKLGVEKGRIAYSVMVGFACGASLMASDYFKGQFTAEIRPNLLLAVLAAAGVGIYILSWYLSVVFYKKREIQ